ncbi:hypothetical protein LVO79_21390 (plasmid) [Roseivivax marinus]|jgi:hypothetical protein|uniref:hypothetical protein n=1 Tax=Roseivivax marinus TaxID=1379903 RepID=UPI00103DFAA8|nr:hypothetical protein [Roseivivax marinus]UMA67406.1 hypothetical protein LVO79_21390 [Roseivivax marinus]
MELAAGQPQKKGNKRRASYAYHVKKMRHQEMQIAEKVQESYEHFVAAWRARPTIMKQVCGRLTPAGTTWAARWRFQPTRHASLRGRPHAERITDLRAKILSISSVECNFARCCWGKVI